MRNKELIEKRNRQIANIYYDLTRKGLRYDLIIRTISETFYLTEFRIQAIIRDMVRHGTFTPAADPTIQLHVTVQL